MSVILLGRGSEYCDGTNKVTGYEQYKSKTDLVSQLGFFNLDSSRAETGLLAKRDVRVHQGPPPVKTRAQLQKLLAGLPPSSEHYRQVQSALLRPKIGFFVDQTTEEKYDLRIPEEKLLGGVGFNTLEVRRVPVSCGMALGMGIGVADELTDS